MGVRTTDLILPLSSTGSRGWGERHDLRRLGCRCARRFVTHQGPAEDHLIPLAGTGLEDGQELVSGLAELNQLDPLPVGVEILEVSNKGGIIEEAPLGGGVLGFKALSAPSSSGG